jgi:ribonuclease BN (tRNA processing enzyme)
VKIRLLDSACGNGNRRLQYATTFLVNDTLAIDSGALGLWGTADDQARIRNVILTHTHADHIATLPLFVENAYVPGRPPVCVWGSDDVIACLQSDLFNDRVFPNLLVLPTPEAPFAKLARLTDGVSLEIDGVRITPVPLTHTVPTFGIVLESDGRAVAIVTDTAPTDRIWEVLNALPALEAVYLEVTFPNAMHELASVSCHLTPALFGAELRKLRHRTSVVAVHLKARYHDRVAAEVASLGLERVRIAEPMREDVW